MNSRSQKTHLSTIILVLLAVVALALSVLALTQNSSTVPAEPIPSATVKGTFTSPPEPEDSDGASELPAFPEPTSENNEKLGSGLSVLILGDSNSAADTPGVWVEAAAEELGWAPVKNLSAQGRGYIRAPSSCDIAVCSNFQGTIPAIVERNPDVVVTFGGMADGDQDLSEAARTYFEALRKALPEADLIAVSPVTSNNEEPYFLRLHDQTIRAGVEAVGGTFIDVGRPGVGDGEQLSPAAQGEVAQAIIAELS